MLIRGTRIPYDGNYDADVETKPAPENSDVPKEEQGNGFTTKQWIWFGVAAFGAAIGAGLLLPGKKSEKPGKPGKKDSGKKTLKAAERRRKKVAMKRKTKLNRMAAFLAAMLLTVFSLCQAAFAADTNVSNRQ